MSTFCKRVFWFSNNDNGNHYHTNNWYNSKASKGPTFGSSKRISHKTVAAQEKIKAVFKRYDLNGDGTVGREEREPAGVSW